MTPNDLGQASAGMCIVCSSPVTPCMAYRCTHEPSRSVFLPASIGRCSGCALLQLVPAPTPQALAGYYQTTYREASFHANVRMDTFPHDHPRYLSRGAALASLLESSLANGMAAPRRILDIGAGFGHTLWAMGTKFPDAQLVALEPDSTCYPFLESVGARILPVFLDDDDSEVEARAHGPYDVVIASHVLEHVSDPPSWLRRVRQLLSPKGFLVIEVPNSPASELQWVPNHAPHISFFEAHTLSSCLLRAGADLLFIDTCGPHLESARSGPGRWSMRLLRLMAPMAVRARLGRFIDSLVTSRQPEAGNRDPAVLGEFFQYGGDTRSFIRAVTR